MEKKKQRFNTRAFVALMVATSGVSLPITGIANHLYGFSSMTVARHVWMAAHNVLGLLFVIFSIWHVIINRKAFWNHLRGSAAHVSLMSREAVLAGAVLAVILLIFIGHAFHAG
ncbi:MAG: DUF4405 domain-containing protein [Smithellaceae bacterium]|nr:DUF4405 domain-containing protein [Smithellaceae bacterium]